MDTDNFVRVDKAAWYERVRDGKGLDESILGPDLPDPECEFLVDFTEMASHYLVRFPVQGLGQMLASRFFPVMVAHPWPDLSQDALADVFAMTGSLLDELKKTQFQAAEGDPAYKDMIFKYRFAFMYGVMPYLWALAATGGHPAPGMQWAAYPMHHKLDRLYNNEFFTWSNTLCDRGSLRRMVAEGKRYVITDPDVLDAIGKAGGMPSMNGKCPCGSGKKFKACHGKRFR